MFSKFNYYKLKTHFDDRKETKLQIHLKEQNAKLLEKCFNIKTETSIVKNKKISDQLTATTNEMELGQGSCGEGCRQTSQQTSCKVANKLEKLDSSNFESPVKDNPLHTSTKHLVGSKKRRVTAPPNPKNFSDSKNSKPSKAMETKCSGSSTIWRSPFISFTTKGVRTRIQRNQQCSEFSYHLSHDELKFVGPFCRPMRPAAEAESLLLKSGQRKKYLKERYEHAPVVKYNYPEATSWRIGWFQHNQ